MASPSPALLRLSIASTHHILCSPATVRPFSSQASRCSQTTTKATSPTHTSFHHRPSVPRTSTRCMHKTPSSERHRRQPLAHNKEPVPEQPPTTDFGRMDVLAAAPVPSTAVEVCHHDGFGLNSGVRIENGDGALLVGGEAFSWRPWSVDEKGGKRLVNEKGQWEVGEEAWGVLGALWPRPDLLILGLGPEIRPLSPATRRAISNLGMRVEVLDTRNAASQYNMLATERGMGDVAAALIPIGWKEGRGAV